jgi:hypothetical protein
MSDACEPWEAALNDYIDWKIDEGQYSHVIEEAYVIGGCIYEKDEKGLWKYAHDIGNFVVEEVPFDTSMFTKNQVQETHNWLEEGF